MTTEHKERVILVLQKQINRTDKHRLTGRDREETQELIKQLTTNENDNPRPIPQTIS